MKLVFLTSRFPYPLEKGDKLRAFYMLRELSKYHEIVLISVHEDFVKASGYQAIQGYCSNVYTMRLSNFQRVIALLTFPFNSLPLQCLFFYNNKIHKEIKRIITLEKPDHIFCQLTRMTEYVKDIPVPKTLDYMDAFGTGMYKRAKISKGIRRWLFLQDANRMCQYEQDVFQYFDHHMIISERDRNTFPEAIRGKIEVIQNGIDHRYFIEKSDIKKQFTLIFVGNMGYLPNIEAVQYIVQEILPLLPDCTLLIAGAGPSDEVMRLASDRVTVTGWVEDIRDAYASAQIFGAPIFYGTGQQNKILEAMAMGLPCVTSAEVNDAIGAKENTEILLAKSPEEFAKNIEDLIQNHVLYQSISSNARTFAKKSFDWASIGNKINCIFAKK